MRGSPFWNAIITFFAMLSVGFPLWRLTHTEAGAEGRPAASDSEKATPEKAIHLQLVFSPPPKSLRISHFGKELFAVKDPAVSLEKTLTLPFPSEGVDLVVELEWPPEGPQSAARFDLTGPSGEMRSQTIWGSGTTVDVVTCR